MTLAQLKEHILPAVFNKDGSQFVDCEFDSETGSEAQFQSSIVFVTVTVTVQDKRRIKIPLVVKFEPQDEKVRKFQNTTIQFYNEVIMYGKVLPFLNRGYDIVEDTFAKFYHGVGSLGEEENVLMLQNLKPLGYKMTEDKCFIDYPHLALAMTKLGRFHALSYAAKNKYPEEFKSLSSSLKDHVWTKDSTLSLHSIVQVCLHRAVDPIVKRGRHVDVLQKLLARVDDSVYKFMKELVAPEEPLAVICHGDFCRNNVLYKYDSIGKPIDVKFFDIATSRYCTPMADIAFFLFLNSSKEVREAHLDDLLKVYHDALSTAVPGTEVPSLVDIRKEFLHKAIYGFVHCSFFLPIMLFESPFQNVDSMTDLAGDQLAQITAAVGGEEGTKVLSDMVEELVDRGCLTLDHTFLRSAKAT